MVEQIDQWYQGRVVNITSLRPGTVIKDDAIPLLLRQGSDPIFVTINTTDFWGRVEAENHFCIACFPLPDDRVDEAFDEGGAETVISEKDAVVVYKEEGEDGFVITAFMTSRPESIRKRGIIWKK